MFSINLQSRKPIYDQLYTQVEKLISLEVLKPGDKLPTVRELACSLGINPNTASKAYQTLERDGIICTVIGKGSFISQNLSAVEQKKKLALKNIETALDDAFSAGLTSDEIQNKVKTLISDYSKRSKNND